MSKADYVDGLLEGHESQPVRGLYRFFVVSFVILSLFCGAANLATIGKPGFRTSEAFTSVAILGLTVQILLSIKWYRQDNQDPKHRRFTALLIVMVLVLDIGACVSFHETMSYTPPSAPAGPEPTTAAPMTEVPATPSPTNNTNVTTAPSTMQKLIDAYAAEARKKRKL